MRSSTHFGLNLVEGSDIVNPLVQDVPNYETIDEEMFNNKNAGIAVATELKSGSVHAITRTNPNGAMFRFTSTSIYNFGDSFTVDGVSVTALMPNGTAIGDKAYIVGSTVLCALVGTQLTIFGVGSGEASDSQKLGGNPPSYYATKAQVDNATSLATNAGNVAQSASQQIATLSQGVEHHVGSRERLDGIRIGYITTAGTELYCTVHLTKPIGADISNINLTGKGVIRCNGVYVEGTNGVYFNIDTPITHPSGYTDNALTFKYTLNQSYPALNNMPVAVHFYGAFVNMS